MHVISFITTERQGSVWNIWFKWVCHIHARMRCWARPPRQKSNDEGSLHSFSICMHDMNNLQNKCEWIAGTYMVLRFKYTTKFSLPKIACPAIVYAEIVVVIDPFFVGVCPLIKVYRYNPTEICQQRLQGVRNVAQKLCSWERSFSVDIDTE